MKIIWALTTYNRIQYLRKMIESWEKTHNPNHEWTLLACDDGSNDGTVQLLKSSGFKITIHNHKGIHHQTNSLIKRCSKIDFDIAFKTDDDLIFKLKSWDDKYIEAINETGYDHLNFHDLHWKRKIKYRNPINHKSKLIQNRAFWFDTQGAFWTLTPRIITKVGYFDLKNFGACGLGHRDYTFRCCRAGFNVFKTIYDVANSNKYIELIKKNYTSAPMRDKYHKIWNSPNQIKNKKLHLKDKKRIYIPWNTIHCDIWKNILYQ